MLITKLDKSSIEKTIEENDNLPSAISAMFKHIIPFYEGVKTHRVWSVRVNADTACEIIDMIHKKYGKDIGMLWVNYGFSSAGKCGDWEVEINLDLVNYAHLPPCPFCNGEVKYHKKKEEIKQPDSIQCIGNCNFEITSPYYGNALELYMMRFVEGAEYVASN